MAFIEDVRQTLERWFLSESPLHVATVVGAAMVVYVVALSITRIGKHRFLGGNTVFDVLLGFILGSTLSRAINGGAGLTSSALAGFVLIGMHYLMSVISSRSHNVGRLVKGGYECVVTDGVVDKKAMSRHHLTEHDLEQALRKAGVSELAHVKAAYFERSGEINVVPALRVRVVDVDVDPGVQKVRIEVQH